MTDPFTLVYNGLWLMAERNIALTALIPPGNRIKYQKDSPPKSAIANADTPELALLSSGATYFPQNNSSNMTIDKRYAWLVTSGDFLLREKFNPITFELFRAMIDWESTLCPLEWESCTFVTNFKILDGDEGINQNDAQDRSILGWSSLLTVEVRFALPTSRLRIT